MVRALLLDKKGQSPAPVKVVEESCVTCGGAYFYRNCPATDGNNYRDNIQEFVSQASAVNLNQGNTGYRPSMMSNSLCSKDCKKNNDSLNSKITDLTDKLFDAKNMIYHYKLGLAQVESILVDAVPPPPAQIYSFSKKDLSWTGLLEFADDTVTNYSRPSPTMESTSGDDQNRNPYVSETVASPIMPKPFIKFVKPNDSQSKSKTDETETPKKPSVKPPVRPVRTNMNGARPNKTTFNKQVPSCANRPFNRTSAVRSHYRAPWVPTVNRNVPPVNRKFSTGSRNF
nr:hypothetical protein [Tanacetum cinerariifolium]